MKTSVVLALAAAACPCVAAPSLLSGFEAGFGGWTTLGDATIQTAEIGTSVSQGRQMAFLTTMGTTDLPYGSPSPNSDATRSFLGLPPGPNEFAQYMPPIPDIVGNPWGGDLVGVGEGAAIKARFFVPTTMVVSFDWKRIGQDNDSGYFTIWGDDPGATFRFSDWLF